MNTVTLIGTLTKDPEIKNGNGESKVCRMRLAESNAPKGSTLFINVSAFGREGENCDRYLSSGRQVAVAGQLRSREYEFEGKKRTEHSIKADRVDFLGGKKEAEGQRGENSAEDGGGEDF